jgi:hypothetical protein
VRGGNYVSKYGIQPITMLIQNDPLTLNLALKSRH